MEMKRILLLGLFVLMGPAHAAFTGPYDVSNWTLTTNGGDGTVDTSGAPNSIILTGSNSGSFNSINTDYTITAVADGLVSFSWAYSTFDASSAADPFRRLLNDVFVQLTDNAGGTAQSGNVSFSVSAGDVFGFRITTVDDLFGSASTTISDFSAPVPLPPAIMLLGAAVAGLGFARGRMAA